MANIEQELLAFKNAKKGEDVRDSMISAIRKINTVNEEGVEEIEQKSEQMVEIVDSQIQIDEEPTEYTKLKLETTGQDIDVLTAEELNEALEDTDIQAEMEGIRVPASGFEPQTPYTSAGQAVRGQVTALNAKIEDVEDDVEKLNYKDEGIEYNLYREQSPLNYYWQVSGLNVQTGGRDNNKTTNVMTDAYLNNNDVDIIALGGSLTCNVCTYDANNAFIKTYKRYGNRIDVYQILKDSNAKSLRFAVFDAINPTVQSNANAYSALVTFYKSNNYKKVVEPNLFTNSDMFDWKLGIVSQGEPSTSNTRAYSDFLLIGKGTTIWCNRSCDFTVSEYSLADKTFDNTSASAWLKTYTASKDCYVRLTIKYSNNASLANTDLDAFSQNFFMRYQTLLTPLFGEKYEYKTPDLNDYSGISLNWVLGALTDGAESNSVKRIRTNYFRCGKDTRIYLNTSGFKMAVNIYDFYTNEYITNTGWVQKYTIPYDCVVRIVVGNSGDTDISDVSTVSSKVDIMYVSPRKQFIQNTVYSTEYAKEKKASAYVLKKKKTTNEAYAECDFKAIFMTDIHAEKKRLARAVELSNSWGTDYIDAVINGGDTDAYTDTEDLGWYYDEVDTLAMPILNTVGNHDAWSSLGVLETDSKVVYNNIIKPIVTHSMITQPTNAEANGYNYYYKDFNNVRVIVLDCMYWNATQKAWFEATLSNALSNSLHVLCVTHASFPWVDMTWVDTLWSKAGVPDGYSDTNILNDSTRTSIEAVQAVDSFIDNGGQFICWLTGHQHGDDVHKLANYNNQFVITMASFVQRASMLQKSDSEMEYNYDCLTYLTVDTTNKIIKFMRFGADIDMYGVKHNGLSINYDSKKVIASY